MTEEPTARGGIEGYPTGLSWYQHHRVARVVAAASTDAEDCALLLAVLGIHPADGLKLSPPSTTPAAKSGPLAGTLFDPESGIRRKRRSAGWARD